MFLVICRYPIGEGWEARDAAIYEVAGRFSDWSSAEAGSGQPSWREHRWKVRHFREARDLKRRLAGVGGVECMVREQ